MNADDLYSYFQNVALLDDNMAQLAEQEKEALSEVYRTFLIRRDKLRKSSEKAADILLEGVKEKFLQMNGGLILKGSGFPDIEVGVQPIYSILRFKNISLKAYVLSSQSRESMSTRPYTPKGENSFLVVYEVKVPPLPVLGHHLGRELDSYFVQFVVGLDGSIKGLVNVAIPSLKERYQETVEGPSLTYMGNQRPHVDLVGSYRHSVDYHLIRKDDHGAFTAENRYLRDHLVNLILVGVL